jgi:hypothetical protein
MRVGAKEEQAVGQRKADTAKMVAGRRRVF